MDWLFQYTDPSIDWGYAMSTLVVRFLGVFVVLGIVQVAIQVASRVIGAVEARAATSMVNDAAEPAPVSAARSVTAGAADLSAARSAGAETAELSAMTGAARMAADLLATNGEGAEIDDATAAAIGLALALEAGDDVVTNRRIVSAAGSSSAWAMAGRLRNLR